LRFWRNGNARQEMLPHHSLALVFIDKRGSRATVKMMDKLCLQSFHHRRNGIVIALAVPRYTVTNRSRYIEHI
jgi:hypothetical protein